LDSGRAIGAIQEALNAQDDMKAVTGLHDASLGAQGNETSGRAILARQQEGDTSNYHFLDNLSRAIEHGGRIMIDLIPTVYSGARMIRVLGIDRKEGETIQLGQPMVVKGPDGQPKMDPATNLPMTKLCALDVGKYDLTVDVGPSYGSKRQEAAEQMTNFIQAYPNAAPILGDLVAKNLDWPEHEEAARRLRALLPPQVLNGGAEGDPMQNPQVKQTLDQAGKMVQALQQQNNKLTQDLTAARQDQANKSRENDIDAFEAQTARLKVVADASKPAQPARFEQATPVQ
jgi:hypothetical protein